MTNSFIRLPPDSTGKRTATREHEIDGLTVNIPAQHISDPTNPERFLAIDEIGAANITFSEGQPILGGFGELKITGVRALGVYDQSTSDISDLFSIEEQNGGQNTYSSQDSCSVLSVNNQNNSRVVKTTNRYHYYLAGSANLTVLSLNAGGEAKTNNIRRWGLFDDFDGLFFQVDGNGLAVVLRSSVTGSVEEEVVYSTSWNGLLNQTQLAQNITLSSSMVWWIDYQWLGAGRVRFGFFTSEGKRIVLHTIKNSGTKVSAYMRTGTLPIRFENLNTGVTSSSTEMREICSAIYCEGDFEDYSFWRFQSDIMEKTFSTMSALPFISIRSKELIDGKPNKIQAYPELLNVHSDHPIAIHLYFQDEDDDIPESTQWVSGITDCSLEFNMDDTFTLHNNCKFRSFFSNGIQNIDLSKYFEVNDEAITPNNFNQFLVLAVEPLTSSAATVKLSMGIRELW